MAQAVPTHEKVADRHRRLLKSGEDADFIVRCPGRDFNVHIVILQNGGDYFRAACGNAFKERKMSVLKIDDCEPGPVLAMVQFIYHDEYDATECTMGDLSLLLHAAVDKFGKRFMLPGLQDLATSNFATALELNVSSVNPELMSALKDVAEYVHNDPEESGENFRMTIATGLSRYAKRAFGKGQTRYPHLDEISQLASDILAVESHKHNTSKNVRIWECTAPYSFAFWVEVGGVVRACPRCERPAQSLTMGNKIMRVMR